MLNYDGEQLLSAAQVAQMFNVKTVTVRGWLSRRLLASVKLGQRSVRIPASEVSKLVERGYTPALDARDGR